MGRGWTHTFNDMVRSVGSSHLFLYRVDGEGHETTFEGPPAGPWVPVSPAESGPRQIITFASGQYVLTDVDGNRAVVTAKENAAWWMRDDSHGSR